jgi:hypothetical protein
MAARPARAEDAGPEAADGDDAAAAHDDAADAEGRNETDMILDMVQQARGIDQGKGEIARLQEERRLLAGQKRQLTKALRNESRKRTRLIQRSSKLTVPDLVQSLYIRQARAQEREHRAQERAAERQAAQERAAVVNEVVM